MTTHRSASRGVSELVGTLLLLITVLAGVTLIVFFAGSAVDDFKEETSNQQVDDAFVNLKETLTRAALSDTQSQHTHTIGLEGQPGTLLFTDDGEITISANKRGSGNLDVAMDLNSLTYREEERRTMYQGGGVFSTNIASAEQRTVSPPMIEYYEGLPPQCERTIETDDSVSCNVDEDQKHHTLSLTLVGIDEESYTGDSIQIDYPNDMTPTSSQTLVNGPVTIEVTSEHYAEEWQSNIVESSDGHCDAESAFGNTMQVTCFDNLGDDAEAWVHIRNATLQFR